MKTELFVSSKIPDNIAKTAFHALERLGFEVEKLERNEYHKFEFTGDKKFFERKISKVDILVNANKHSFSFSFKDEGTISVLVQDLGQDTVLLKSLRNLGFNNIRSVEKGTLWTMYGINKQEAERITKELLMNPNYQKWKFYG
ncbi:hypothetical protein ISS07_05095 [Candidatus Woesearchaeota archaeon]|nr:hypothetical protein [Candidatus Woesearchaeota archaeon]